jgi:hypothetical protein
VTLGLLIVGLETAAVQGTPELPADPVAAPVVPDRVEGASATPIAPIGVDEGEVLGPDPLAGFASLALRPDTMCAADPPRWEPARPDRGWAGERVMECVRRLPRQTDARIPFDQRYDLTTFGGPGDEQPTHCEDAPDADGTWFYAANGQRFVCGQRVRLVDRARTRCVIVQVADLGPHICVEAAGGRPAWDVSPLASRHLFGVRSAGWSEHREVFGAPVAPGNPLGPCSVAQSGEGSFIGGACRSDADCVLDGGHCLRDEEGWPDGHCTTSCIDRCPVRDGPYALSACTALPDGSAGCLARCDFTLYETGCRSGYGCIPQPVPGGTTEPVCVPAARCE